MTRAANAIRLFQLSLSREPTVKNLLVLFAMLNGIGNAAAQITVPKHAPSYEQPSSGWPSDSALQARASETAKATALEVQWAGVAGTASIQGQAFLKTRGGDVKLAAGERVYLIPYCARSTKWLNSRGVHQSLDLTTLDRPLYAVSHVTRADAEGRFRFDSLPAGAYYVVTRLTWEVPGSYGQMIQQGGDIISVEHTELGKAISVVLTH